MWPFSRGPKGPKVDDLIYAIGDIHGRNDLLARLLEKIEADRDGEDAKIVFLGDYIDRGPDSSGVLDTLINRTGFEHLDAYFLKGNHEATLLDFLDRKPIGPSWADFGAYDTLASYGVSPPKRKTRPEDWEIVRSDLAEAIPETHRSFYEGLLTHLDLDPYFFAHAGINPARAIEDQTDHDLMWIRKPFLKYKKKLDRFVVHGHSARKSPIIGRWRLGIDTGAYMTGRLTAVRINRKGTRLLHT